MLKRYAALFSLFPLLGLVGCVGQSAYEKKSGEATSLSRELADIQRRNTDLVRDNEVLRADIYGLKIKIDELETVKKRLEQTIGSGEQTPYQFVAELEREKGRLREDLSKLLRTQDDRVRTSSRIYESFLERMKGEIAQGRIRVSELRGTIKLEFQEQHLFDGNKTDISPQGTSLLRKVATLLKDIKDSEVSVESSYIIPLSNGESSNKQLPPWRVPILRCTSVAGLILQSGVASTNLSTNTRGEFSSPARIESETHYGKANGIEISIAVKE